MFSLSDIAPILGEHAVIDSMYADLKWMEGGYSRATML